MAIVVGGLAPAAGHKLVELIIGRALPEAEWDAVQKIGELLGWHPEALRQAAIEGREVGWQGMLGELSAGRMPWIEIKRSVMLQWARLRPWPTEIAGGANQPRDARDWVHDR